MRSIAVKAVLVCVAILAAAVVALVAAEAYVRASGSDRLLAVMRQIRPGATKKEVRDLMGREPSVVPAGQAPQWIEDCVPQKERGEFWHFFMRYPSRHLIIYFDENVRVSYTTWAPT